MSRICALVLMCVGAMGTSGLWLLGALSEPDPSQTFHGASIDDSEAPKALRFTKEERDAKIMQAQLVLGMEATQVVSAYEALKRGHEAATHAITQHLAGLIFGARGLPPFFKEYYQLAVQLETSCNRFPIAQAQFHEQCKQIIADYRQSLRLVEQGDASTLDVVTRQDLPRNTADDKIELAKDIVAHKLQILEHFKPISRRILENAKRR